MIDLKENWPKLDLKPVLELWGALSQLLVQHNALVEENKQLRIALSAAKELLAKKRKRKRRVKK